MSCSNIDVLTEYLHVPGWNKTTLTPEVYQQMFEQNLTQYNLTGIDREFRHCSMEEDLEKVGTDLTRDTVVGRGLENMNLNQPEMLNFLL